MPKKNKNRAPFVLSKKQVATWLEDARSTLAYSKAGFARFIGTTPQNYNHILKGLSYPRFENLSILCSRGFNIDSLLKGK